MDIAWKAYTGFIGVAAHLFTKCEYSGNVEMTARLEQVRGEKLLFSKDLHLAALERRQSEESELIRSDSVYLPPSLANCQGLFKSTHLSG